MRRTFILHASGSKLPTDLLGLTCVRYDGSTAAAVMKVVCQKLRNAIENEGRVTRERPLHPDAPQLDGTGEDPGWRSRRPRIGDFTTRGDTHQKVNARTAGVYLRADPEDMSILDGRDDRRRAELIAEQLRHLVSIKST